jgi:hypothetical protein
MSLAEWDEELAVVAKEIETVKATHGKTRLAGNRGLVARKVSIIQAQLNVERNFAKLKKLIGREMLLLPRERTMVHWTEVFVDRAEKFHQLRSKLLSRGLWVKLIMTRALGENGKNASELDADDLVALSIRQDNLSKTEKYLSDSLLKLKERRKSLVTRYEQLGIADANRTASLSMASRLGRNPEDALNGPGVKALGSYVKSAAAPLTAQSIEKISGMEHRIERRTDGLFAICKAVIFSRMEDPGAKPSSRAVDKFHDAMRQLDELEDDTREAMDEILRATPSEAHPRLRPSV